MWCAGGCVPPLRAHLFACARPQCNARAWPACPRLADQRHHQPGGRHPCVQAGGQVERVLECRWAGVAGWVGGWLGVAGGWLMQYAVRVVMMSSVGQVGWRQQACIPCVLHALCLAHSVPFLFRSAAITPAITLTRLPVPAHLPACCSQVRRERGGAARGGAAGALALHPQARGRPLQLHHLCPHPEQLRRWHQPPALRLTPPPRPCAARGGQLLGWVVAGGWGVGGG